MHRMQHAGAFVVQFRAATDFDAGCVEGRVEHVATGRTARFDSVQELLAIIALALKESCGTQGK